MVKSVEDEVAARYLILFSGITSNFRPPRKMLKMLPSVQTLLLQTKFDNFYDIMKVICLMNQFFKILLKFKT